MNCLDIDQQNQSWNFPYLAQGCTCHAKARWIFFKTEVESYILYCMKISRHENFAVSRSWSKNHEIKMPRKTVFSNNRKIKILWKTIFSVNRSTAKLNSRKQNRFFDCAVKIHKNPVLLTIRNNLSKKIKSKTWNLVLVCNKEFLLTFVKKKFFSLGTAKLKCSKINFFSKTAKLKCCKMHFFSWTAKIKCCKMQFSIKKPQNLNDYEIFMQ